MTVYYAHFMGIYNTPQEKRDIETLEALGFTVFNPNNPETQAEIESYERSTDEDYARMFEEVFFNKVRKFDAFAFRGLPDGRIPGGVYMELQEAELAGIPIIELPSGTYGRGMDKFETRQYLKEIGQR